MRLFYREGDRWADELATVLSAVGASRPVICAWSYGERVLFDYLGKYGTDTVAGLVLVSATSNSLPMSFGSDYAALAALHAHDSRANVEAVINLWNLCGAQKLDEHLVRVMVGTNMLTPPYVRRHMAGRTTDFDDTMWRSKPNLCNPRRQGHH